MDEETVTVKKSDLNALRRIWHTVEAFSSILNDGGIETEYSDCGKILALITAKFGEIFEEIDFPTEESQAAS